ncbi:MAG TPA: YihY/virulence factor BrkB family protein [Gaiellaceae bacterium]|nr:YihY/virulence factor BrkB family protein [Gaiellaceae bacterium]
MAVRQKYADDQGSYLAATVAYYGFFSIFPLLLVSTTVVGFVLHGHPHLQHEIVDSALGQFPVIGRELHARALKGSTFALIVGSIGAIWAGMRAVLAAENAMNQLWGVPFKRRPDFAQARLRALLLLVIFGGGALATTLLAGAVGYGTRFGAGWKILSIGLSTLLDFALFWIAFRVLTARDVTWRSLRGGAAAAAAGYEALQLLGGYYVGHVLATANDVYGTFALVIGLLSFVYLAVHVTLLAAECNVVATRRLWPRSFSIVYERPATVADRAALTQRGKVEERRQDQQVDIHIPVDDAD